MRFMTDRQSKASRQSQWLKLMLEGQLTRDPVLKTRTELDEDQRRAAELEALRQKLTRPDGSSGSGQ